tara:strand:- start:198 stop:1535 length:1338 start_codon:yes stop_codon:yes gene_type:complete
MARISTYGLDNSITIEDILAGTDGDPGMGLATKNFSVGDLAEFIMQYVEDNSSCCGSVTSLTTIGTSGPSTLIGGVLNIPDYATGEGIVTGLTTTGTAGPSTLIGGVLNVPDYDTGGGDYVLGTGNILDIFTIGSIIEKDVNLNLVGTVSSNMPSAESFLFSARYEKILLYSTGATSMQMYMSTDSGASYTSIQTVPNGTSAVVADSSLSYIYYSDVNTVNGSLLHRSNDAGATFSDITLLSRTGTVPFGSPNAQGDEVISRDGKYLICYCQSKNDTSSPNTYHNIMLTSDYGLTFNDITEIIEPASTRYTLSNSKYALSGNGEYMLLATSSTGLYYKSTDYGVSWAQITLATSLYSKQIKISFSGQYVLSRSDSYRKYSVSNDYGATFTDYSLGTVTPTACDVSNSGQYMIIEGGLDSKYYVSSDYGVSFTTHSTPIINTRIVD